jgi:folate-binding protein YgfZ
LLLSGESDAVTSLAGSLRKAGVAEIESTVYEQVRIESGWPEFGRDISRQNLPQEIDRDSRAISFEKGCYLGQETVARIDAFGHVNQKLVGLKFSTPDVPAAGTELIRDGKTVGTVTSAVFSPRLSAALAMGYVRREHNILGTRFDFDAGTVEVVQLPLPTE